MVRIGLLDAFLSIQSILTRCFDKPVAYIDFVGIYMAYIYTIKKIKHNNIQ